MKKIFLFAAAALFAACSGDDLTVNEQPQVQSDPGAVGFEAYTQRGITRAGWAGSLTTNELQKNGDTEAQGFGVFGYYTDNNDYEQRATPNFFYNQQVKWNGSTAWTYEPVKYWPNEYGNKAISDDADKVTYFAYAPYVKVIPSSGKVANTATAPDDNTKLLESYGITGMSKNTSQGDPLVKYIASFNTHKSVDLCWGVADNNDGVWPIVQNDAALNIANGTPWLNVQRPASVEQKVKFTFKHATAQMRVNIDAIFDEVEQSHGSDDPAIPLNGKTRIWVREVKFKGFALKGTLNLNNDDNANKPYWLDYNGQNELVAEDVIVYDGRKDGKEGVAGAIATNEKVLGLNPALVQDGAYEGYDWDNSIADADKTVYNAPKLKVQGVVGTGGTATSCERTGVTTTKVNLFNNAAIADEVMNHNDAGNSEIFHVIPVDEDFEVEIVYDVETVSENLAQNLSDGATKGTSIENRIRKTISFGNEKKLKSGHSYTLNLHLGMNSVEFDAAVTDWIEEAAQDVDLPLNAPLFSAAAKSTSTGNYSQEKATIPYDAKKYVFAINGLDGGESVAANLGTDKGKSNSSLGINTSNLTGWDKSNAEKNAGTNGIAIEELTTQVNPTTSNRTQVINWKGKQSEKGVDIIFTQLAHPLGLHVGSDNQVTYTPNTKTITLQRSTEITGGFGWMCAGLADNYIKITADATDKKGEYIIVKRNGVTLTWATSTSTDIPDTFTFSDNAGTITLKDDIQAGDVYEVTLKTGDAPAETISIKIVQAP